MKPRMKTQTINYCLLLPILVAMIITACKDPYIEPPVPALQDQSTAQMRQALPNLRPALVLGAKSGQINVSPYKCRPADSMVCVTLVPKLEIPEALVNILIDIPIGPDPCPFAISCPPFVSVVTELVDIKGNPIPMEEWEADPLIVEDDFLFIQFNNPQDDALLSENTYALSQSITLDPSWTKYLGLEGNVINKGVYYTQYNKEYNCTTMAVPLEEIGHQKR